MLFSATGITKRFGDVIANDDVSLEVEAGEVHALLGENGAGKSTLVKMMYGILRPDQGSFQWKGQQITIDSPAAARALGIGMVFQHFSLFEALTVAENIALALPAQSLSALKDRIQQVSTTYGLTIDPNRATHTLSVGEKQRVEIIRCLLQEPRLLIMDEPTSVLTPQEANLLFETLRRLRAEGCSILYISHRLEEIKALCDRATILRQGKRVADCDPSEKSARELAELMVGSEIGDVKGRNTTSEDDTIAEDRLVLKALNLAARSPFETSLKDISLSVRSGEIVGIAGVAGEGQVELMEALIGERLTATADMISFEGAPVGRDGPSVRRAKETAFIPEERNGHGAVPTMSLSENILLTRHGSADLVQGVFLRLSAARALSDKVRKLFDVRAAAGDPPAGSLSGGNLQKFIVGREIDRAPRLLIVSQPTWGVDAGAATTIRTALVELANAGTAVLMFSQDLEEIFAISDRIAVIHRGQLTKAYPAAEMTAEKVGLYMGGAHPDSGTLSATVEAAS